MTQPEETPAPTQPVSRRERVRASTVAEIKTCALALMREQGSTQVHFSDIARSMGMTAPALYRYFDDRDDLLTALIRDAYSDVAKALADAVALADPQDDWGRLQAGMQAYRSWALAQPERFTLIFGLPVPGFVVDESAGTTEAATSAMDVLMGVLATAAEAGRLVPSVLTRSAPELAEMMAATHSPEGTTLSPVACQGVFHAWLAVHGLVSLEASGQFHWLLDEMREQLFVTQVELAARAIGIAVPAP